MPMELAVHAADCPTRRVETCGCRYQLFTDPQAARQAHDGDFTRLEIIRATPPEVQPGSRPERSQGGRHRAISW